MEEKRKAAGLVTERVIPTYFHLALPVVVGSIITIIYTLADTYFIARTNSGEQTDTPATSVALFVRAMKYVSARL